MKCTVKDCTNHSEDGAFIGFLCSPCARFVSGEGETHSQAYRNARSMADRFVADAERYRWMKREVKRIPPGWFLIGWDYAIDSAMEATK